MLRDQFVLGVFEVNIRTRLLSQSQLSFDRSIEIATIDEPVNADAVAFLKSHNSSNGRIVSK